MRASYLSNTHLPESAHDIALLVRQGEEPNVRCCKCGRYFTSVNVRTQAGWTETQISGLCEDCFDERFGREA